MRTHRVLTTFELPRDSVPTATRSRSVDSDGIVRAAEVPDELEGICELCGGQRGNSGANGLGIVGVAGGVLPILVGPGAVVIQTKEVVATVRRRPVDERHDEAVCIRAGGRQSRQQRQAVGYTRVDQLLFGRRVADHRLRPSPWPGALAILHGGGARVVV